MAQNILEQILENVRRGAVIPALRPESATLPAPGTDVADVVGRLLETLDDALERFGARAIEYPSLNAVAVATESDRRQLTERFRDAAQECLAGALLLEPALHPPAPRAAAELPSPPAPPPVDPPRAPVQETVAERRETQANLTPTLPEDPAGATPEPRSDDVARQGVEDPHGTEPEVPATAPPEEATDGDAGGTEIESDLGALQELLGPIQDLPRLVEEKLQSSRDQEILRQLGTLSREIQDLARRPAAAPPAGGGAATEPPPEVEEAPRVPLDDIQKMIEFLK